MFCILLCIIDIKCAEEPTTQHKFILVLILVKKTRGLYHSTSIHANTQYINEDNTPMQRMENKK
jgi:hypothetical protein